MPPKGVEKKQKKAKAVKDPNAPKKPSGPYIFFCNESREAVKKAHPEYAASDIFKALGAMWKELSDDKKAVREAGSLFKLAPCHGPARAWRPCHNPHSPLAMLKPN